MLVYYDLRETAAQVFGQFITDADLHQRQAPDHRHPRVARHDGCRADIRAVGQGLRLPHGLSQQHGDARAAADQPAQPADVQAGNRSVHRRLHRRDAGARRSSRRPADGGFTTQQRRRPFLFSTRRGRTTATCARRSTATGPTTRRPRSSAGPGRASSIRSKTVAVCHAGNAGSRNQNIYTARISGGLLVGAPGNSKPLSTTLQRGFVVFAQNDTTTTKPSA